MVKCQSVQELLGVAEAEETAAVTPVHLEAAEREVESAVRVDAHARHPGAAIDVSPEAVLLVKGDARTVLDESVLGQLIDDGSALGAEEEGVPALEKGQAVFRGHHGGDLEDLQIELLAGGKLNGRIGEVLVGEVGVEAKELRAVDLPEVSQAGPVDVVPRDGQIESGEEAEAEAGVGSVTATQESLQSHPGNATTSDLAEKFRELGGCRRFRGPASSMRFCHRTPPLIKSR